MLKCVQFTSKNRYEVKMDVALYGNFGTILDHFSRLLSVMPPHARRVP